MKTLLIKFFFDGSRMGDLYGKALMRETTWNSIQNRRWYASDVLGKHSEVWGTFEDDSFSTKEITDDQLEMLSDVLDFNISELDEEWVFYPPYINIAGFSPYDYIREEEE
jgi:hypothetical protein